MSKLVRFSMLHSANELTRHTDEDEWAEEIELEEMEDEEAALDARGKQVPSGKSVAWKDFLTTLNMLVVTL
jgi:hypothetical protein